MAGKTEHEPTSPDLVERLRSRLGTAGVLTGSDAAPMLEDWRGVFEGSAIAVVRPASTTEVAEVVGRCAEEGVAIVPQGGNTGLSGGATPVLDRPCVVLSLTRMNRVEPVDPAGSTMVVEAGCTIEAVQQAARAAGCAFAPDWGARGTATVGGAIATDAGGINVLRHGNIRPHILGVEVVLPDGRIWDGLRSLRKDSSGYDLKQLFIGSEGTLGVVTRAVLSLEAARPHERSAFAALSGLDALMPLLELARRRCADALTAFELIPRLGLERVTARFAIAAPLPPSSGHYALLKLAGATPVTDGLASLLEEAASLDLVTDAVVAAGAEQEERLWRIRDELPIYRLFEHQAIALKNDTAVPVGRITEFLRAIETLVERRVPDAVTYGFGHVGDGNLHIAVLPDDGADPTRFLEVRRELRHEIDALTFRYGGTLSAEHGVGRELRDRIIAQKPAIEWEMMRTLKTTMDPRNVMNPGALFADRPLDEPPEVRS